MIEDVDMDEDVDDVVLDYKCGKERLTFKSFPQAIKSMSIKTVAQLDWKADPDNDDGGVDSSDSVFYNQLVRWTELNLTEGFTSLLRSVRSVSRTLPLVVFNQHKIFEVLKHHAERRDALYLEPVYQLLCGLAQDVQDDFLTNFYPQCIAMIADTSRLKEEPDILKSCFESFNQIVKIFHVS